MVVAPAGHAKECSPLCWKAFDSMDVTAPWPVIEVSALERNALAGMTLAAGGHEKE